MPAHPVTGPPAALLDAPLGSPGRPSWRGRLHLLALTAAVPLVVLLAVHAAGARARSAVIVYGVGLCSMLAVSTTYHRWVHTVRARAAWRRADHATIFAAIAGTFTGLALIVMGTRSAVAVLVLCWSAAVVGAVVKLTGVRRGDLIGGVMYLATGWAAIVLIPALWARGGPLTVGLVAAGGIVYTLGAIGFRQQWPRLRPSAFSYHEVWHACTIAAAGLHFTAIWRTAGALGI